MSWLVAQVWVWMVASAGLGALVTLALTTTRVEVERWTARPAGELDDRSAAPVEPSAAVAAALAAVAPAPAAAPQEPVVSTSPFPPLPGADPAQRPWEAEELWSRPARLADPTGRRRTTDEWSEAASSWRSWADEAVGRGPVHEQGAPTDDDLFAADREAERLGLETGVFPTSFPGLVAPVDLEHDDLEDEDGFPHARPVEAAYADNVEPFPGRFPHGDRRSA